MDAVEFIAVLAIYGIACGAFGFPGITAPIFFILLFGWIGYMLIKRKK